jgi:hypothetical protein
MVRFSLELAVFVQLDCDPFEERGRVFLGNNDLSIAWDAAGNSGESPSTII